MFTPSYTPQQQPYFNTNSDGGLERSNQWHAAERQRQMDAMLSDYYGGEFVAQPAPTPVTPTSIEAAPNPYAPGGALYGGSGDPTSGNTGGATTGNSSPNIYDTASSAYNAGVGGLAYASNPMTPALSMNAFLNPYRDQVITNALGRQRDDLMQSMNMVQTQAAQQGAFGGARHGLVEAELLDRGNRNAGELAARMLQQGFDTSAGLGLQGMSQNRIASQALMSAAPVGFNMGNQAMSSQMAAGGMQQNMLQSILDAASGNVQEMQGGPLQSLRTALLGAQGNPLAGRSQTTEQFNPGMLQFMQFGAGLLGGK